MSLGLRLEQKQTQQLVMTPQLQQAIRLLQMSNLELCAFVEAEVERNPLLRLDDGGGEAPAPAPAAGPEAPLDARLTAEGDMGLAAEVFDTGTENLDDSGPGDGPDHSWQDPASPDHSRPDRFRPAPASGRAGRGGAADFDIPEFDPGTREGPAPTLREHLLAQLGQMRSGPVTGALARYLAEELDEHGYLRTPLAELGQRVGAAPSQLEPALALLQSCEPTGVGARSLAECLALQLAERDRLDPAMRSLVDNLELLARGERRRLKALCGVDDEDFDAMLAELRALDPRPCSGFAAGPVATLIPDIFLRPAPGGGWDIELNPETLPRLIEDRAYAARLSAGGREARAFVAECRAGASWLRRSLDQRARSILKVAAEIVRHQDRFFAEGIAGLRPLTLRMVAEATGLHESTASRVTANKYISTGRGIFELKFFFTNAIGGEDMAAESVRHRIRAMIDAEAPAHILSDDTIVDRLRQDGVDIARRTVAKYRNTMGIPSSVDRRRQKALGGAD